MGKRNKRNKRNNAKAMALQFLGGFVKKSGGGKRKNKGGGGGAPASRPPAPAPAARAAAPAPAARAAAPASNPSRGGGGGGGNKRSGGGGGGGGGWSMGGGVGGGPSAADLERERRKQGGRRSAASRGGNSGTRETLFEIANRKKNEKKNKKNKKRKKDKRNDSVEMTYFDNNNPVSTPDPAPPAQEPLPTFDYAAQMEAMLAPLRTQIEALTNNVTDMTKKKEEAAKTTITGSSDSGISGKASYTYTPGSTSSSSSTFKIDTAPNLFNNWVSNQDSLNKASTAYLFAPGGTRREDEVQASGSSASSAGSTTSGTSASVSGTEGMQFWNQTDSDLTQAALGETQYDEEERRRRAGYFGNGDRVAGSIFGV